MTIDPDDIADQVLLLDGPHDADDVHAAAQVVAELVRRLNHATLAHKVERVLFYPSQVDRTVSALATATSRLPQLCAQLSARMRTFAHDERLGIDNLGNGADPVEAALIAADKLSDATGPADQLAGWLSRAARSTSRLTYRQTPPKE